MSFKMTSRSMDLINLALANCIERNRSIKLMEQLSNTINWGREEPILLTYKMSSILAHSFS